MQSLSNLLNICNLYKQGKFDIEEFQGRIITASIPENLSKEFLRSLVDFDNELETIIFCAKTDSREDQGHMVADKLIQSALHEQNQLKAEKKYTL